MSAKELRPIRIPTLAEARLLVPTLKLPRRLPADAAFEDADWFLNTQPGWESMAVRYRVGGGWLTVHQVEPAETTSIRTYEPAPRVLPTGRTIFATTLTDDFHLVDWQEEDGRRFELTSNVLAVDQLAAIAETVP